MRKIITIAGILCLSVLLFQGGCADDQAPPADGPKDCTDYAKAAATLGITQDALKAAIHPGPDYAGAAATLGVTEDALKQAMGTGEEGKRADFAAAAATLGVTEDALKQAMGFNGEGGPGFGDAATKLGISEDTLKAALEAAKTC